MDDNKIINMYKQGYSIDYITKIYYKYMNRNKKPITIGTMKLYPVKLLNKSDCRLVICEIVYKYLINGDMAHT